MNRKCEICKKEIEVIQKKIGGQKENTTYLDSDEGIYFEDGNCWFCEDCYNQVMKEVNVDYKKFL